MYIHCHHHTLSTSTNDELQQMILNGTLDACAIHRLTAKMQTQGRGQYKRTWLSPQGNVYLSLYIPSHLINKLTGLLSPMIGLHLCQMPLITNINHQRLAKNLPVIGVKWPNDLGFHCHDECHHDMLFYKLAGILIEPIYIHQQLKGIVIGVGLNVNTTPIIDDRLYQACALADLTDNVPSLAQCYEQISTACLHACWHHQQITQSSHKQRQKPPNNESLIAQFEQDYNAMHTLNNQIIAIFAQNNMDKPNHIGRCLGIHGDGTLKISQNSDSAITHIHTGMARLLNKRMNKKP